MPVLPDSMPESMMVFDRRLVRRHRDRAAARLAEYDFLLRHVGAALLDRLYDVKRGFAAVLDLGCHDGTLARLLAGRKGIETIVQADLSPAMAALARGTGFPAVAADEEALPFAAGRFDLVISNLSLHWVNDLPGALLQIRRVLKPDGMFLGALLGGETLQELRRALVEAEIEVAGGISPRLSPLADVRDAGGLLQRAGFALPVVDRDTVTATYGSMFRLIADLRGMGETNANLIRNRAIPRRALWAEAARRYDALYAEPDGRVPATFQVIYLAGWAPHESQQQALRPGSAKARLAAALGTAEMPAGDRAGPRSPG